MSEAAVFRDSAETLGIKTVLEVWALGMSGDSDSRRANLCTCMPSHIFHHLDGVRGLVTHDLVCPMYRFMIICGGEKVRERLVDKAFDFVRACMDIDKHPDAQIYNDVILARKVLCLE